MREIEIKYDEDGSCCSCDLFCEIWCMIGAMSPDIDEHPGPSCPGPNIYKLVPKARWEAAEIMCGEILSISHNPRWVMGQLARRAMGGQA